MIRLQEHLEAINPHSELHNLAEDHWNFLNPTKKTDGNFRANSLCGKIDKYYSEIAKSNDYLLKIADGDLQKRARHKKFFQYLRNKDYEKLKLLIKAIPGELERIRGEIYSILEKEDINSGTDNEPIQTNFGTLLSKKIFNYSGFRKTAFCRSQVEKLGVIHTTCPYCNYHFIDVTDISNENDKENIKRAYLDLDHFMPKSQNPFFALSFYNLIPSCHTCNSGEKKSKPFSPNTHVNPFDKSFDDYYIFKLNENYLADNSIDEPVLLEFKAGKSDSNASDLRLHQRFKNGVYSEALTIVNNYLEYSHCLDLEESESKEMFVKMILDHTPVKSSHILNFARGKLHRDLINQIDVSGLLDE